VQLSLLEADGPDRSVEWALCGLIRADRFRAESSAVSPTYWLSVLTALALLCLGIPILKLHIASPRERLARSDAVLVALASFAIAAILTFAALDVVAFGSLLARATDRQLSAIADRTAQALVQETAVAFTELAVRAPDSVPAAATNRRPFIKMNKM